MHVCLEAPLTRGPTQIAGAAGLGREVNRVFVVAMKEGDRCLLMAPLKPASSPETRWPQGLEVIVMHEVVRVMR